MWQIHCSKRRPAKPTWKCDVVTQADVRRAGEQDRGPLGRQAAHTGPIADDTVVDRIAFHLIG